MGRINYFILLFIFLSIFVVVVYTKQKSDHTRARGVAAYEQIRNIDTSFTEQPFGLNTVEAKITLLSQKDSKWKIRVDKINSYSRFPGVPYQLKEGDIIDVFIPGFIESYARKNFYTYKDCTLKQSSIIFNASRPLPTLTAGDKWSAHIFDCYTNLHKGCKSDGWTAYLYNQDLVILEYDCTGPDYYD